MDCLAVAVLSESQAAAQESPESGAPAGRRAGRDEWLRRLSLVLLLMGALGLAWMFHRIGVDQLWDALGQLGWGFALSSSMHLVAIALDSVTLQACVSDRVPRPAFLSTLRLSLSGHAINEATPMAKLGELAKFSLLAEITGKSGAAAALIVQNFLMFTASCTLMAIAPLIGVAVLDIHPGFVPVLLISAAIFAITGALTVFLLYRGLGGAPLRLARRLGVSAERVERWGRTWRMVEANWRQASAKRPRMLLAWSSALASRMANVAEVAVILAFIGVDDLLVVSMLTVASGLVVFWLTSFVPMQAGTAEGGTYFLFRYIGLPAHLGVLVELVRRVRRILFIGIGVTLLGWQTFRDMMRRRDPDIEELIVMAASPPGDEPSVEDATPGSTARSGRSAE